MHCQKCGNKLSENAKFCGKCGSPSKMAESSNQPIVKCGNCGYIGEGKPARRLISKILAWLCVVLAPIVTIIYFATTHKYKCPKCQSTFVGIKNKAGVFDSQSGSHRVLKIIFFIFLGLMLTGIISSVILASLNSARQKASEANNTNIQNTTPREIKEIEGVKITILKEGNGEVAKSGDTVAMNYTGKLTDGTVFDSNVDPKFGHVEPFVFTIDSGMVIKGWDVGVAGMKVGEKRNLLIQPDFAYRATGAGGIIPPNATLNFNVELVGIK